MKKWVVLLAVVVLPWAGLVMAQQPYGVGDNIDVPYVPPGTLAMDGSPSEEAWESAATVDMLAYWEGEWSGHPVADVSAVAKLLWTEDTLFVYVRIEDYDLFFGPDTAAWWGEQIFIGIDRTLAGDRQVDDSWSGFPWNAPDKGPVVYKIYDKGITLNWGANGISPVDSGWVAGTVFVDDQNFTWGVEAKFWVPRLRRSTMIGFNIGGATATSDSTFRESMGGEGTYAYFCWHPRPSDVEIGYPSEFYAGDIMRRGQSFGTLTFVGGGELYGIGDEIQVPYVEPGTITLDGEAAEPAWDDAATRVDMMAYWEGAWSGHPVPDVSADARLLWTDDTLFAYVRVEDYDLFFGPDTAAWWGEQIFIAIDGPMYGDPPGDIYDPGWGGAPWNLPDKGPAVYKIYDKGITANWGSHGIFPVDSGWVAGKVVVDNVNLVWGVEMKMYLPQVALGTRVGFNIGGATATSDSAFRESTGGEGTYAYFCWHPQPSDTAVGYPSEFYAGDLMRRAKCFGTLRFLAGAVGVAERSTRTNLPVEYALEQNYPNPFNPSTNFRIHVRRPAKILVDVINLRGQHVATIAEGNYEAGTYLLSWDASGLPSGVYIYRLWIGDKVVAVRKGLLLK